MSNVFKNHVENFQYVKFFENISVGSGFAAVRTLYNKVFVVRFGTLRSFCE